MYPASRPRLFFTALKMTAEVLLLSLSCCRMLAAQTDSLLNAGFSYLDKYATTQDLGDARDAFRAFTKVLESNERNAQAHLGLGLTYAAVERQQLDPLSPNDATRPVNNTMAVRHLVEALHGADVDVDRAARALVMVTRREYDKGRLHAAVQALESQKIRSGEVQAAIGELYISLHDVERAEVATADPKTPNAKRVHSIAQLLQTAKVQEGGQAYFDALTAADPEAMDEFVRDARWIADSVEAASWSSHTTDDLKIHLARFWQRRAVRAGVSVPERLATHFARVQHATEEFSYYRQRVATRGAETIGPEIDTREYDVDDRAFTYVRYGEPDERITTRDSVPTAPQSMMSGNCKSARRRGEAAECPTDLAKGYVTYPFNETWVYRQLADHPVSFDFFLPPGDPHGWTLVADVVRCASQGTMPYSEAWLRDRMSVDPRYGILLAECEKRTGPGPDAARVQGIALPFVAERIKILEKAAKSDNAVPRPKHSVPVMMDVLQFAGDARRTDVTAVVTWPLRGFRVEDGVAAARVTFSITDTLTGTRTVSDTSVSIHLPPNAPTATARLYLHNQMPPSANALFRVSVHDLNADSTFSIVGDTIDVRSLSEDHLTISDIAIVSGGRGSWTRGDQQMSLLPRGAPARDFGAYYEAYGLPVGAHYTTTFTFQPQDEGLAAIVKKLKGSTSVSFTFNGENSSADTVVRELRALKSELPAGKYLLGVTVESAGQSARAARTVVLP